LSKSAPGIGNQCLLRARVAQWVRLLDLTTHTSLSPIRRGFVPSFVNYKKGCNCSCFEIVQEMDAILLIIGIVYGVCRIVIKSLLRHQSYLIVFMGNTNLRFWQIMSLKENCESFADRKFKMAAMTRRFTSLVQDHPIIIPAKSQFNWLSGF
jgi:hypothetical protein